MSTSAGIEPESTTPEPLTNAAPQHQRAFVAVVAIADTGSREAIEADVIPLDATDRGAAELEADELVRENLADRSIGLKPDGSLPTLQELAEEGGYTYLVNVVPAEEIRRTLEQQ